MGFLHATLGILAYSCQNTSRDSGFQIVTVLLWRKNRSAPGHGKRASLVLYTIYRDLCAQAADAMFYDGKAQARTADLLGTALVHPVKALENTILMDQRNTDTRIFHWCQENR